MKKENEIKAWINTHDILVGVPCSKFKNLIDYNNAIITPREDIALGMAIGYKLMGKNPLVFMQDAGIGSCLTLITSIMESYKIEIDLLISIRMFPDYHYNMGKRVKKLMKLFNYQNIRYIEEQV